MSKGKLKCEDCGIDMNYHAEKINYSRMHKSVTELMEEDDFVDEIHTCPECGKSENRSKS